MAVIALGAVAASCSSSADSRLQPSPAAETTTVASSPAGTDGSSTTTIAAEPAPAPTAGARFGMLPPGSALPSDEECAARVRPAPEIRPKNAQYNLTPGSGPPKNPPSAIYQRVTGRFTGTTDEILQWGACKWGIDEDLVRAQAVIESYWNQDAAGDYGADPKACAPGHDIGASPDHPGQCAQSIGILQVRYPYWSWAFPDAGSSTAYNVDVALAARRNCYEGNDTWVNSTDRGRDYAAGDIWGCMGMWFSGRWYTPDSLMYIDRVKQTLQDRYWADVSFVKDQ